MTRRQSSVTAEGRIRPREPEGWNPRGRGDHEDFKFEKFPPAIEFVVVWRSSPSDLDSSSRHIDIR